MKKVVWFTTNAAAMVALMATPSLSIKLQASSTPYDNILEE